MFNNFNLEGCKLLQDAEKERKNLRHPYVGSEHLLLSILKNSKEVSNIFKLHNISYASFKSELVKVVGKASEVQKINLYTPLLKRIIANSIEDATENNNGEVLPNHYVLSILEEGEGIAFRLLLGMDVNIDKLHKDLIKANVNEKLYLNEIGVDLNSIVNTNEQILNRDEEIDNIIEILIRKKKNNPILIGEAGVGKTAIVEELSRRIVQKRVPEFLENKKIIMLEMGNLVAGTKYRGEFEEKLTKVINEVINNDNIILFIDEIHTMINAGGAEGAINASDILKPYLARGELKCIGATTPLEYENSILKDKALSRRFEKIMITEPGKLELKNILIGIKKEYEDFHKVKITKRNISDIMELSDKYITNKYNPDKAIDLLDTVCAYVKMKKHINDNKKEMRDKIDLIIKSKERAIKNNNFDEAIKLKQKEFLLSKKLESNNNSILINKKDILKVIGDKLNKPLPELQLEYIEKIFNILKKNVVGQDEAINRIYTILKDYFTKELNKPLALHLIGPKKVGKSYTAKLISEVYGNKYPVIDIDFKEFKDDSSLNKLIGASAGYVGFGEEYLLKKIRDNVFSIVIINNFNEGNEKVKSLIKNIIEKGKYLNGKGEVIYCLNTLFILTSTIDKTNHIGFCDNLKTNKEQNLKIENTIIFKEKITT